MDADSSSNPLSQRKFEAESSGAVGGHAAGKQLLRADVEAAMHALDQLSPQAEGRNAQLKDSIKQLFQTADTYYCQRIEALEGRLSTSGPPDVSAVQSVVARMTAAPTNWHQVTVFALATDDSEDDALKRRAPLLFLASAVMVFMQTVSAAAISVGTFAPSCVNNEQCDAGMFCATGSGLKDGGGNRCGFCGDSPLDDTYDVVTSGVYSDPYLVDSFVGYNATRVMEVCTDPSSRTARVVEGPMAGTMQPGRTVQRHDQPHRSVFFTATAILNWCDTCFHVATGDVDIVNANNMVVQMVDAMVPADFVALFCTSIIIGLVVAGELKDIELCLAATRHAGTRISKIWKRALQALCMWRRFVFLPGLVSIVPQLMLHKGGDALAVALNALAVLFLVEIDNVFYSIGLSEAVQMKVEIAGRVRLSAEEASGLVFLKITHVVLVALCCAIAVPLAISNRIGNESMGAGAFYPILTFHVGSVLEILVAKVGARERLMRLALVVPIAFAALVCWIFIIVFCENG